MNSFTYVSWVCVLTLLYIGQSSAAGMVERRDLVETYVQDKLDALEKKLKAEDALFKKETSELRSEQSKLKDIVNKQDDTIKKHADTITQFASYISGLTSEQSKLKDKVKNQDDTIKKQGDTIIKQMGTLEAQKALQKEVAGLKDANVCLSQKIGFLASLATHGGSTMVSRGQIVVYGKVITNVGNAYDPSNGHFTATAAGLYAFTVNAYIHSLKKMANLNIKVNKEVISSAFVWNQNDDAHNSASARAVVMLSAGDVVTVWADDDYGEHTLWQGSTSRTNVNAFSGELLQPDC